LVPDSPGPQPLAPPPPAECGAADVRLPMSPALRSVLVRYGVAALAVALAVALTHLLRLASTPYALAFAAVLLSAWVGRLGPGLFAAAAAVALLWLLPPGPPATHPPAWDGAFRAAMFLLLAGLALYITRSLRRAEQAAAGERERLRTTLASI